jgi:hypothetical protein
MADNQYKITSLSKEQEARCPEYVARWTAVGTNCSPADRKKAETSIKKAYKLVKAKEPQHILWYKSPLAMIYSAAHKHLEWFMDKEKQADRDLALKICNALTPGIDKVLDSQEQLVKDGQEILTAYKFILDPKNKKLTEADITKFKARVSDQVSNITYGQHEAGWLSFYSYFREVCGLEEETEVLTGLFGIAESAGWLLSYDVYCFVSERHNILQLDDRGRLNATDGPAIAYPDGLKMYAVHGVQVPADIIEDASSITPARIDKENNAEVRRVMMDKFGVDKYLLATNAKLVNDRSLFKTDEEMEYDHKHFGKIYHKDIAGDEPIKVCIVQNGTFEYTEEMPNGGYKMYTLRIPPTIDGKTSFTARRAVAWSYGLTEPEYEILIRT